MSKVCIWISLCLCIFLGLSEIYSAQAMEPHIKVPITVKAELVEKEYYVDQELKKEKNGQSIYNKGFFSVKCNIINNSKKIQNFWMWSGSYYDNWKTDNSEVHIRSWGVGKNFPTPIFLKPGESVSYTLPLKINPATVPVIIRFRLGLNPYIPSNDELRVYNSSNAVAQGAYPSINPLKGIYWSNILEIKVKE